MTGEVSNGQPPQRLLAFDRRRCGAEPPGDGRERVVPVDHRTAHDESPDTRRDEEVHECLTRGRDPRCVEPDAELVAGQRAVVSQRGRRSRRRRVPPAPHSRLPGRGGCGSPCAAAVSSVHEATSSRRQRTRWSVPRFSHVTTRAPSVNSAVDVGHMESGRSAADVQPERAAHPGPAPRAVAPRPRRPTSSRGPARSCDVRRVATSAVSARLRAIRHCVGSSSSAHSVSVSQRSYSSGVHPRSVTRSS